MAVFRHLLLFGVASKAFGVSSNGGELSSFVMTHQTVLSSLSSPMMTHLMTVIPPVRAMNIASMSVNQISLLNTNTAVAAVEDFRINIGGAP